MKLLSFSLLVGVATTPAVACDLCAVYSASQAQGQTGKGFLAGVAEQFTHFGTMQEDGNEVPNEVGQYLDSSVSQVFVGYNMNNRFGVQLNVPIIYRSFKRPEGYQIDRGTVSGLGDISLTGNLHLLQKLGTDFSCNLNLLGGIKMPTGSTDRLKEEFNEVEVPGAPESGIHGHDLTLGSGSWDGIVGSSAFARYKRMFLTANVQYNIRTEGDYDYEFANDLTWSGGPGAYLLLQDERTLSLQLVVSGEYKGKDTFQGESAEDTGVTSVYLGPEVGFTWSEQLSAEVGVDLPVSIDNTALQAVPDYRIRAALTWRF
jgi:hypothetical protein